jgi:sporadic carbohydrate cluster protein (TIGR04323 family)
MPKLKNLSFRGYISSRHINGNKIPQSLQNLKIRDYANLKNIDFKLSVTEYRMKKSFFALNSLKKEISTLNGIIFFSIYQLPEEKVLRKAILNFFIQKRKKIFFALEDIELKDKSDMQEIENIFFISKNSKKI